MKLNIPGKETILKIRERGSYACVNICIHWIQQGLGGMES